MRFKRLEKVARMLQREMSQLILYELSDPHLGFVTVTRVEPSLDLKTAKVFISILDVKSSQNDSLERLNKAKGYIQNLLGHRLKMRYIPIVSFHIDDSIEKMMGIDTDISVQNSEISQKIKRR
ncbi:MAG: 30S ribosome-binding factor RbfA [Candidatus Brocadiia bacterium]